MELEYCHKNGSTVWMEVNASLLLDADGQILGPMGCRETSICASGQRTPCVKVKPSTGF